MTIQSGLFNRVTFLFLWCIVVPFAGYAQKAGPYGKAIQQARHLALQLVDSAKLPGFSVAVAVGDSVVWAEGFGFADIRKKIPVKPATRFRIGSVSKLLTAATSARLSQRGVLNLDLPVEDYLPSFPWKGKQITARKLLGHLGGIRHYRRNEFINTKHYATVSEALSIFVNDSLMFEPGTKYGYSSYGYVLASAMVEGASKRNFLAVIDDEVFKPLAMKSTIPDIPDTLDATRSKYYALDSLNKWVPESPTDNSDRWAAGGFLSTSVDLARFGSAHLHNRFLSQATLETLFTTQKTIDGKETGVGMGWRIAKDSLGNRHYHHGGESIGGRSFLLISPDTKIVVALLSNLTFARFGQKEAMKFSELFR